MQFTVELPNDFDQHPDPAREAVEALAIAGYRSGELSAFQASRPLGMSRFAFEGFLKQRGVIDYAYDENDLSEDIHALRLLEERQRS